MAIDLGKVFDKFAKAGASELIKTVGRQPFPAQLAHVASQF